MWPLQRHAILQGQYLVHILREHTKEVQPVSRRNRLLIVAVLLSLLAVLVVGLLNLGRIQRLMLRLTGSAAITTATVNPGPIVIATPGASTPTAGGTNVHHYEYVFPDGAMYVYDMDNGHKLVKQVSLPTSAGVRGVAASPRTHMLYVSFGGDGGSKWHGSML